MGDEEIIRRVFRQMLKEEGVLLANRDENFVEGGGLQFGEICAEDNAAETAIAVAGTPVQVTIFDTNGLSNGDVTPDHTNDHITVGKAGLYLIVLSATVNSVVGVGSTVRLVVAKNNGTIDVNSHMHRTLSGGGGESGAIAISGMASLIVNDTIEAWIENETNTQNYVVQDISLAVIQIGGL